MQRDEFMELLGQLKLNAMMESWDEIVVDGIRRKRSTLDILSRLLNVEQLARHTRSIQYCIAQAIFPQTNHSRNSTLDQALCINLQLSC